MIDEVERDTKSRARAHPAMSLLTEALAPTNFLPTNPAALILGGGDRRVARLSSGRFGPGLMTMT